MTVLSPPRKAGLKLERISNNGACWPEIAGHHDLR